MEARWGEVAVCSSAINPRTPRSRDRPAPAGAAPASRALLKSRDAWMASPNSPANGRLSSVGPAPGAVHDSVLAAVVGSPPEAARRARPAPLSWRTVSRRSSTITFPGRGSWSTGLRRVRGRRSASTAPGLNAGCRRSKRHVRLSGDGAPSSLSSLLMFFSRELPPARSHVPRRPAPCRSGPRLESFRSGVGPRWPLPRARLRRFPRRRPSASRRLRRSRAQAGHRPRRRRRARSRR